MANFEHPADPETLMAFNRRGGGINIVGAGEVFPAQPASSDALGSGGAPISVDSAEHDVDIALSEPVQVTLREAPVDAASAPLTDDQIDRLAAHRGQPVSPEDVEAINGARANGTHLGLPRGI